MNVKRFGLGAAVLSLSLAATPALAQVCVGVPLNVGQTSVALSAHFPDGANIFGVRGANHFSAPLTLAASYQLFSPEFGDSQHSLGVDAAFELPVNTGNLGFCGIAGAQVSLSDDPYRTIQVPVGVAVGGTFEVDSGISIAPFAAPQLFWTRFSNDAGSTSDTVFGLDAGANLVVSNLFFGALIEKIFEDGSDLLFGVQAGIVF
jgi:hypothetical protein